MAKTKPESRKKSEEQKIVKKSPENVKKTLTKQAQIKLKTIQNKIHKFATYKGISPETALHTLSKIEHAVENASDQKRKAMKILENIKDNDSMANTINELIGEPLSPTAPHEPIAGPSSSSQKDYDEDVFYEPSQTSSRRSSKKISSDVEEEIKKQLAARKSAIPRNSVQSDDDDYMDVNTENEDIDIATMDNYMKNLDITEKDEPNYITHMKNIVKLLKKHPDVKSDINKTLLEMFTKQKIKPEQYEVLKQHIDNKEQPQTIRAKKTPNPRTKKSAQSDIAILPVDIGTTSKLPKGKAIKDNQKNPIP